MILSSAQAAMMFSRSIRPSQTSLLVMRIIRLYPGRLLYIWPNTVSDAHHAPKTSAQAARKSHITSEWAVKKLRSTESLSSADSAGSLSESPRSALRQLLLTYAANQSASIWWTKAATRRTHAVTSAEDSAVNAVVYRVWTRLAFRTTISSS